MEYIFKQNEEIGQEFINKLKNGFWIKTITFELYNEVNENIKNYYISLSNYLIYSYFDIIPESLTFYNNILSFYISPFSFQNINFNTIDLLDNYFQEIEYKLCKIILKENDNLKIYINKDNDNENLIKNKLVINSNYFNSEEQLKIYIEKWTDNLYPNVYNNLLIYYNMFDKIISLHKVEDDIDYSTKKLNNILHCNINI